MKRKLALISAFIGIFIARIPSVYAQSDYAFWFSREGVDVYSKWSCASCDDRHVKLKVVNNNPYKINWSYQAFVWKNRLGNVVHRESGGTWSLGAGQSQAGDLAGWYFYPPERFKGESLAFNFIDWRIERDGEEEEKRKKEEEDRKKKEEEEKRKKEDEQERKEEAARNKEENERRNNQIRKEEELKKQEQVKNREQQERDRANQIRQQEDEQKRQEQIRQQNLAKTQEELRQRDEAKREEEKNRQARVSENLDAIADGVASVFSGISSAGGSLLPEEYAPKYCKDPGFYLEGNLGFMCTWLPAVENAYSFQKQYFNDYSQSSSMMGAGFSANCKAWAYRSLNFGIAATGSLFYHLPMWEDGVNLFSFSLGGRTVLGHEYVKAVVDLGITKRIGSSTLISEGTILFSNGGYTTNKIFTEQDFNYLSRKIGIGFMIENEADDHSQVYYTFMLTREMLDFVKTKQPYYSFKAELRNYLDLEIEYSRNYPIAGLPGYAYKQDGRNKDFFQISVGIPLGLFTEY